MRKPRTPAGSGRKRRSAAEDAIRESYERVPYPGAAQTATHPDRLATVATLWGLEPPPVERCRLLELGCSDGGNLIAIAAGLPGSELVGVDLSPGHVAAGRELAAELGLANVELRAMSLLDVGPELGRFDYVVAHGVFSWVPRAAQEKIFEICRRSLAPSGVAYVSYNAYPGWHLRGVVREMMRYRVRGEADPHRRWQKARELVELLAGAEGGDGSVARFLATLREPFADPRRESYLIHDYLEEHNAPIYFHRFVERARAHGLRYLAEADPEPPLADRLAPAVAAPLEGLAGDRVEREQYGDFATGRAFRRTLLCHRELEVAASPDPARVAGLRVASAVEPVPAAGGEAEAAAAETFRTPAGRTFSTAHPTARAALGVLAAAWPETLAYGELEAAVSERLGAVGGGELRDFLLSSYLAGVVDLRLTAPACVRRTGERPRASPLARLQATRGGRVTNALHQPLELDDALVRVLVRHLDGTRDRAALVALLAAEVAAGRLELRRDERPLADVDGLSAALGRLVDEHLRKLARLALLIG